MHAHPPALCLAALALVSPALAGDPIAQQAYLKATNADVDDQFGGSVSVSGDTVVVGAYKEDSAATGVNGDGDNNSDLHAGAAYVFVRSGTTWAQQAYLKPSNTEASDFFGWAVSVSGNTAVVGAPGEDSASTVVNGDENNNGAPFSGAAYVFVREGATWSQQAYLKASNAEAGDRFGYSVSVSGDRIVIGALNEESNATGVNGDQSDNSSLSPGAAYVFVRSGTTWVQEAYLKASNTGGGDEFGFSVSISADTVVVGARWEDSNATGVNGDGGNDGASDSGAAYVFVRDGGAWSQQAYLKASNTGGDNWFGYSVSVSGDTIAVGACLEESNATGVNGDQSDNSSPWSGAGYVFVRQGTTWTQQAYLKASNTGAGDEFGCSVSAFADTVVVGAHWEDSGATGVDGDQHNNAAPSSGAAYVFGRQGTVWTQHAYLKASNTEGGDRFGESVAVSGDTAIVGANMEDSGATVVNGTQSDNSSDQSGAAYVFDLDPLISSFCDASDGALGSCPCSNPGNPDTGCDLATGTGGVSLALLSQSTQPNGAILLGQGYSTMGAPTAIVIRSPALDPASPLVFGDGLRCVGTAGLVRLAPTVAVGGTSTHVFGHSAAAGPGVFYYQLWFRDTPSTYCDPSTAFNLSSGRTLTW